MKRMMMLLVALVGVVVAQDGSPIPIIRQSQDGPNPDGSFQWSFETGNGIAAREQGQINGNGAMEVVGQSSYTAPDGQQIQLTYVANEGGFQPHGAHLPVDPNGTPAPIPPQILRALEYNSAHPEQGNPGK